MKKILSLLYCVSTFIVTTAQICGTPGLDGPENISTSINSYFPVTGNITLAAGAKTLAVSAVPVTDMYGNSFGTKAIEAGDLLLIIQMQDATINYTNDRNYGSNTFTSGPDGLGGTGFTSLGNTGKFEYVLATSALPLSGGTLRFKGAGPGGGTVNAYVSAAPTTYQGKKTFQVVRVPQFSNLVLSSNISAPPFNGQAGGIIAFDVSGSMNFNGYTIDASSKGFRGGFGLIAPSDNNTSSIYVTTSFDTRSVGKGEGIAGTPRYMWDGFNQVDNGEEGLPGGSYGRGAPANAGGGGNDHNSGGGGGANGGAGGTGGDGTGFVGNGAGSFPNGGRPGTEVYATTADNLTRLIMGGGGGGGDANNALTGVTGGVGGGIVLINAGTISGNGVILANGGKGAAGVSGIFPDGAGGGGAGGNVFVKISNPDQSATLRIEANGGNGGNTVGDFETGNEHGPGGGGGGGVIFYTTNSANVQTSTLPGSAGRSNSGNGSHHNASDGVAGVAKTFTRGDLPAYLQGGGSICYAQLTTRVAVQNATARNFPGGTVVYRVVTTNAPGGGNAGGVEVHLQSPSYFTIVSAEVAYTGDAGGPQTITNKGTISHPYFGNFNISPGDSVILTITVQLDCATLPGDYNLNAQALSFDPSRTFRDPQRKITAQVNAFPGYNTTYETGQGVVPGRNFNGSLATETADDVKVITASPLANNAISKTDAATSFCLQIDASVINGTVPTGGSEVYDFAWQSSTDGINFADIANASAQNFNPPILTATTYYRRLVTSLKCNPPLVSNIVQYKIDAQPVVDFLLPSICLKDGAARFVNQSSIGNNAALEYLWNFGDGSTPANATVENPAHAYVKAGNYPVSLTATSGACSSRLTKTFTLNGSIPKANFQFISSTLCSDVAVQVLDKATVDFGEITAVKWYFTGADSLGLIYDSTPAKRGAPARAYSYQYPVFHQPDSVTQAIRMVVKSGETCESDTAIPVVIRAVPSVVFKAIEPLCINESSLNLTQAAEQFGLAGSGSYDGKGVMSQRFYPAQAGVGNHIIRYTFTANNGCLASDSQQVVVQPAPVVTGGSAEVLEGGSVHLPASVQGSVSTYYWSPQVAIDSPSILHPLVSPVISTVYALTATNAVGCSASATVNVTVLKKLVVPNAFSPNGDGINDTWIIQSLGSYSTATVTVFNRYGKAVFFSKGYAVPWDGLFNGAPLPAGTYYYLIETRKDQKPVTGSITLLR